MMHVVALPIVHGASCVLLCRETEGERLHLQVNGDPTGTSKQHCAQITLLRLVII